MNPAKKSQSSSARSVFALNAFLGVCAAVLGLSVCLSKFDVKIPLPDFIAERIVDILDKNSVDADFDSIYLDWDFSARASSVSLRAHGTPEPFFRAKEVAAGLDIFGLFGGGNFIRYVFVRDGELLSAYDGRDAAPKATGINLSADFSDGVYTLGYLNFRFRNLSFFARGKIESGYSLESFERVARVVSAKIEAAQKDAPASVTAAVSPKKPETLSGVSLFIKKADEFVFANASLKKYMGVCAASSIRAEFGFLRGGMNFVNVDFYASGAKLDLTSFKPKPADDPAKNALPATAVTEKSPQSSAPTAPESPAESAASSSPQSESVAALSAASLETLKISLHYADTQTRERISAEISANGLELAGANISARGISARAGVNVSETDIALFDVDLLLSGLYLNGTFIDAVWAGKKILSQSSYGDDWEFLLENRGHSLKGVVDISASEVSCSFSGGVWLNPIFTRKELADIPEMKDFDFPRGVEFDGTAQYIFGADFPTARVRVSAQDCIVMRLDIDSVSTDVAFSDGILRCENIAAKSKEGWGARGRFVQNFLNYDYDIAVRGTLRPMAIAHFMEDWWTKVMDSFSFADKANLPYTDVRVEGTWGAPENIWCYGFVSGRDALYNGAAFDDFSLFVWVNPTRITLYDIALSSAGGARWGKCFIEWLYDAGDGLTSYDRQRLFFKSRLDGRELVALGGEDAKEVLDVVHFKNPPLLYLSALMFNESNNPQRRRDIFNADISAQGEVSVEMITLLNPRFKAFSDKIHTEIRDANFMFCGGDASGRLDITRTDKTVLVDGEARAENMNQRKFFDFLASLGSGETSNAAAGETSPDSGAADNAAAATAATTTAATPNTAPAQKPNPVDSILGGGDSGRVYATLSLRGDVKDMAHSEGGGRLRIESEDFLTLNLFGRISKAFDSIGIPMGTFDINKVSTSFAIGGGQLRLSPLEMSGTSMRVIGAASYTFETDAVNAELKAYPFYNVNGIVSAVNTIVNPIMDGVRVLVSGTLDSPSFSAKISPADILRNEEKVMEKIDKSLDKSSGGVSAPAKDADKASDSDAPANARLRQSPHSR